MNSPLVHFLSIHAINQRDQTWLTPQEFTPILPDLIYVGHILMIKHAMHDGFVPQFQKYHQQHLISGSLSTMRELISLQVYGMTIATDQYSKPMCHWLQDWTKLYYWQHIILMEKLQSMSTIVIKQAQGELVDHLVAQPISYIQTRDPSRFVDNCISQLSWRRDNSGFQIDIELHLVSGTDVPDTNWAVKSNLSEHKRECPPPPLDNQKRSQAGSP